MRITTRIAAAADRSYTRIPFPSADLADCLNEAGKIDRIKAQLAFVGGDGDYQPFTHSSDDDDCVYLAALTLMEQLHDAFHAAAERNDTDVNVGAVTRQDERLERNMGRGRYVIVRQDICRTLDGVRVNLSVGNPHNVVGQAEQEAWCYAATVIQLWLRIADQVKWLRVECRDRPEIVAEARERNRRAELRREYAVCPSRVNGYCSPVRPQCPLFGAKGVCRYAEVAR